MSRAINKSAAIIIMVLFLGSMFYFNPENILNDLSEESQINNEQIDDSKLIDDSVIEAPTRSVIDYNQIYSGETIKTDIEFNRQIPDIDGIESGFSNLPPASALSILEKATFDRIGFENLLSDNSANFDSYVFFSSSMSFFPIYFQTTFRIYAGGSGTLYYEFYGVQHDGATTNSDSGSTLSGSYSDIPIHADGYIYIVLLFMLNEITGTPQHYTKISYLDSSTGLVTKIADVSDVPNGYTTYDIIEMMVDYLYFVRDTITNNVRSKVQYSGPTVKTISIDIPSVPHAKEIRVYTDLDYSSINPTATVTRVSDYWKIASPVEITYEMLFTSTCDYHLALKEVSSQYLTDIGFETGEYLSDWVINHGNLNLNTQVSFDGFTSLDVGGVIEYFEESGDACDFEVDVEEFDIKLNGLDTIDTILHNSEYKLRLYEAVGGTNLGARRDNLAIDTDIYTVFSSEICMSATEADRIKITLHFSDTSTQDYTELIANGVTEEFSFDITAGKTIEMIDIYYGRSDWYSASGDRIYVSYINIQQVESEITDRKSVV